MALSGSWRQVNQYMYADDRQPGRVKTALSRDLLEQAAIGSGASPKDLVDPIRERLLKLTPGASTGAGRHLIVAAEMAPGIADALTPGRTDWQWVTLEGHPTQLAAYPLAMVGPPHRPLRK